MTDWLNRCHFGDVRDVLRRMIVEDVKVNTIITSPPYWGLRSYLPADHPDKASEIGSEPTLAEFLATMVGVFDLCRHVLADDGTMWVNMGDSYASSAGGYDPLGSKALNGIGSKRQQVIRRGDRTSMRTGLKPKDLVGQPWRLAFALQEDGWYLRQDIIWHKPNPMPESIRDRCTKSHEYIFLLSKSEKYFYDFEAMQEPVSGTAKARSATIKAPDGWATHEGGHGSFHKAGREKGKSKPDPNVGRRVTKVYPGNGVGFGHGFDSNPKARVKNNESFDSAIGADGVLATTRNRRSVWTVPSEPFSGAHFATFPRALVEPCVLAGAPPGGVVLDIFLGSGTTAQVAQKLGRDWIGIDIDTRNEPLQRERLRQPGFIFDEATRC